MTETPQILVDFVIRQLWHKVSRMYNQKAAHHGITSSIGFILMIIDKDGTPSTQLGPRMGMEPTSLSRTLKTMEDSGYIRREFDKIDKRKVLIFLTELGIEKRRETREVIVNYNKKLSEKIPQGKLKVYFEVLEKIEQITDIELDEMVKYESKKS
ncbi:MAG: MarR family transcriptional regulator [Crocinitomicaceae bacterium]|jgi:MarR family transcriptional regulator, organic hydroperoxide resistance regulator